MKVWIIFIYILGTILSGSSTASAQIADKISLNLDECIQMALKENQRIQASHYRYLSQQTEFEETKSKIFPKIELTDLFGVVPEARGDATFSPNSDTDYTNLGPFNQLKISFQQPIYSFGRFTQLFKAAETKLSIALAEQNATQQEIIYLVKKLYYSILLTQQLEKFLGEIKDKFQEGLDKAEKRYQDNDPAINQADILKLKIGLAKIKSNHFKINQNLQLSYDSLQSTLGINHQVPFQITDQYLKPEKFQIKPMKEYLKIAFSHNEEWKKLQAGLIAKKSLLEATQKEYLPIFFIGGEFKYAVAPNRDDQTNPFVHDDFNTLTGGAALGFKWDWEFSRAKKIQRLQYEYEELLALEKEALENLPMKFQNSYNEILANKTHMELMQESRKAGRALLMLANANFQMGLGEGKELFEALSNYTSTASEYYQAIYEYNLSVGKFSQQIGYEVCESFQYPQA